MIRAIPKHIATTGEQLQRIFSKLWGEDNVVFATMPRYCPTLTQKQYQREAILKLWRRSMDMMKEDKENKRPLIRLH